MSQFLFSTKYMVNKWVKKRKKRLTSIIEKAINFLQLCPLCMLCSPRSKILSLLNSTPSLLVLCDYYSSSSLWIDNGYHLPSHGLLALRLYQAPPPFPPLHRGDLIEDLRDFIISKVRRPLHSSFAESPSRRPWDLVRHKFSDKDRETTDQLLSQQQS